MKKKNKIITKRETVYYFFYWTENDKLNDVEPMWYGINFKYEDIVEAKKRFETAGWICGEIHRSLFAVDRFKK